MRGHCSGWPSPGGPKAGPERCTHCAPLLTIVLSGPKRSTRCSEDAVREDRTREQGRGRMTGALSAVLPRHLSLVRSLHTAQQVSRDEVGAQGDATGRASQTRWAVTQDDGGRIRPFATTLQTFSDRNACDRSEGSLSERGGEGSSPLTFDRRHHHLPPNPGLSLMEQEPIEAQEAVEDAPSLVEVLKDQARSRKVIDPDALFNSVSPPQATAPSP